jgi:hypothetical protein
MFDECLRTGGNWGIQDRGVGAEDGSGSRIRPRNGGSVEDSSGYSTLKVEFRMKIVVVRVKSLRSASVPVRGVRSAGNDYLADAYRGPSRWAPICKFVGAWTRKLREFPQEKEHGR